MSRLLIRTTRLSEASTHHFTSVTKKYIIKYNITYVLRQFLGRGATLCTHVHLVVIGSPRLYNGLEYKTSFAGIKYFVFYIKSACIWSQLA